MVRQRYTKAEVGMPHNWRFPSDSSPWLRNVPPLNTAGTAQRAFPTFVGESPQKVL
jgi:hypothetical protein